MSNCNKHNTTCGDNKINAKCTKYSGEIPEWSPLHEEDCINLEQTTEDLYDAVEELRELTDFSEMTSDCLDLEEEGEVTPKSVAQALLTEVEELKCNAPDIPQGDLNIECLNLDFKCLTDPCGEQPTKLSQLLQLLLNKLPCE